MSRNYIHGPSSVAKLPATTAPSPATIPPDQEEERGPCMGAGNVFHITRFFKRNFSPGVTISSHPGAWGQENRGGDPVFIKHQQ